MTEDDLIAGAEPAFSDAEPRPAAKLPYHLDLGADLALDLREATADDVERIAALLAAVPAEDLLPFTRLAVTAGNRDRWRESLRTGRAHGVLAVADDGTAAGVSLVERCRAPAMDHAATLEVVVAPGWRGHGLGAALAGAAAELAFAAGAGKLIAPMLFTAAPALALFRRLGFQIEALLRGQVRDADGRPHDLVLMAFDLEEWSRRMVLYGLADALEG